MKITFIDQKTWKNHPNKGSFIYFEKDGKLLGDKVVLKDKSKDLIENLIDSSSEFSSNIPIYILISEGQFFKSDDIGSPQCIQIVKSDTSSIWFFMSLTDE